MRASKMFLASLMIFLICFYAVAADNPMGLLIAEESFDYGNNLDLDGCSGGTGWDGAWFNSPLETAHNLVIVPGLEFEGLKSGGGCLLETGKDNRTFRNIDVTRPEVAGLVDMGDYKKPAFGKHGTTVWVSFLIKRNKKNAYGGIHFLDGIEPEKDKYGNKKHQRLSLGRNNTKPEYYLGRVTNGGKDSGAWQSTVVSDDKVRLLVYKFNFKDPAEEAWMWIDPAPGKTPEDAAAAIHAAEVSHFFFNAVSAGGAASFDLDELRIGTSFDTVVPGK